MSWVSGIVLRRELAEITRLAAVAQTGDQLFADVSPRLLRAVPHQAALWFATDPATLLPTTAARVENIDRALCESFWSREFHVEDLNLFRDLARARQPAASLMAASDERPARSARYREFLKPQGLDDELRAVLRSGGSTWGLLSLSREQGRSAFSEDEIRFVTSISSTLAAALRAIALRDHAARAHLPDAPGLIMFDEHRSVTSLNDDARHWLEQLAGHLPGPGGGRSPDPAAVMPVVALVARARAVAAGYDRGPARLRSRTAAGRWLMMHGSCLQDEDGRPGPTAIVIEPARAGEIAPILIEAYELTPREEQITQRIAQGASTSEIAASLFLSVHTVRDHVKAIFEKAGVSSRGELVATIFAERYSAPDREAAARLWR